MSQFLRLILCVLSISGTGLLLAQNNPTLEELTIEDGLSQGFVNSIFQDKEGFLWIGTRNGLNRYDGREFKVFIHDPLDPYSISENNVIEIREAGDCLLIRTLDNLNIFYKKTQRFYRLKPADTLQQQIAGYAFKGVLIDEAGTLWCKAMSPDSVFELVRITLTENLHVVTNEAEPGREVKSIGRQELNDELFSFLGARESVIWGASKGRIFSVDKKSMKIQYYDVPDRIIGKGSFIGKDKSIWFVGDSGFGKISGAGIQYIKTDFRVRFIKLRDGPLPLVLLSDQNLVGFDEPDFKKGALHIDAGQTILTPGKLKIVLDVFLDRSGIFWLGTNGYGIIKYSPLSNRFKKHFQGVSVQTQIFTDKSGNFGFWLRQGNGSFASSPALVYYTAKQKLNGTTKTLVDHHGSYWTLTQQQSSNYLREKTIELFQKEAAGKPWVLRAKLIAKYAPLFTFESDANDDIWIAHNQHLFHVHANSWNIDTFNYSGVLPRTHRVFDLKQTRDGTWWIGTNKGLVQAVPAGPGYDFKLFKVAYGEQQSVQHNEIASLLEDPRQPHILWIGTLGGGLSRLDTRTMQFRHYGIRNGFPDNKIYGVLSDTEGLLWMSSNKGIIRFDPATGSYKNYTVRDGLPTNEFNMNAYAKLPDGTMLFGGIEGVVSFHPKNFSDNPVSPQISITGLDVNNQPIVFGDSTEILKQTIEFTQKLELSYAQNSVTFHFAALEFTISSNNKFRYYLKGAEAEWAHLTTEGQASYLNLSPGKYTFLIKCSNSDGVWNEIPRALELTILPPWYRSNWAYGIYILLLAGLGYGILRFFLHRQRLQYKLAMEHREAERLKELDVFKSRVFTNITHEFRTPLTVIQGMADRIMEYKTNQAATGVHQAGQLIKRNGAALLRLINQLLDLAKLEAKVLTLNPEQTDLVAYVKYLAGSFQSLAATKAIQLHVQSDPESLPMAIDQEQLQTILHNLLSNAIKFTPAQGEITLQLRLLNSWQNGLDASYTLVVSPEAHTADNWVALRLLDNGVGIAPERILRIFDRFNQSSSKEGGGSGIGLALVKELIQLMQGALAVRSEEGQGTEFIVLLPVRQAEVSSNITPGSREKELSDAPAVPMPAAPLSQKHDKELPTLLIVEDNPDVLQYLTGCVETDYKIITAIDGQEGIEKALETIPDIIISDVMMPRKDGFEVVQTLKNDERTSHIPIVLLTAKADLDSRIEGLERGADVYLAKPFDRQELLVRLRKLLELRRKLQERYAQGQQPAAAEGPAHYEDIFMNKVQSI
ncbi:MAG: response regulator, partial [Lewinellaceae bacterium]|nr:response regulator [Lewinellaceae bacterium]